MRWRWLAWSLAAAALVAVVVFGFTSVGSSPRARAAPALPAEHLAGPPLAFSGTPQTSGAGVSRAPRGPLVVVFWASWCGPCVREAPAVERFFNSASGRGRVVGVDWSDGLSGARSFVRRFSWSFPNLRDSDGTVGLAYRVTGLPTTFVVDSFGRIRATLRGPQDERSLGQALASVSSS
ncbi:MAG TPA: TlpA disulfide reductase family protein [Solirubrobacteraceae bacterium]|jgi:thiol-disulfide isomerase/thioredoxin